jgi:apolipoprotein N-acyltransferase
MPLLIAVRSLPAGRAALTGAAWGLGILLSFLLHRNSAFPIHWPGLSIALIVAVPTAYAGVGSILTRRFGFRPVLLALGWIGAEVALRPLGLPNGLLGETQRDARLAHILVNALGYGFIGALIVFANGILLHVTARAFRFPSIGPPDHCKQDDDHVLVVARGLSPRIAHEIHVTNPRAPPRPRRWRSGRRI